MTQDLDWLADAHGDLRPEVVEALSGRRPTPPPGRHVRRAAVRQEQRGAGRSPLFLLASILIVALAAYLTFSDPGESRRHSRPTSSQPRVLRTARVTGTNVQVRSGPSLSTSVLFRLQHRDQVAVLGTSSPWVEISTNTGSGWVYGAFVPQAEPDWIGPAVVLKDHTVFQPERISFWTGQRLLVEALARPGYVRVALPDGRRFEVPSHLLLLLE